MKRKIKTVAVYCGHEFGINPAFVRDAGMMGELIGKNGLNMVFGGGDVGLMGTKKSKYKSFPGLTNANRKCLNCPMRLLSCQAASAH